MKSLPAFGVQAAPTSQSGWLETARRCEDSGFEFFCVGDHPGGWPSLFTALGAAASATTSILLGPYVANAGLRDPLNLATDIATLDIVSDGRAVLGLGAGHTPQEWAMRSLQRPSPNERIERLIATAEASRLLLSGGTVSLTGQVELSAAALSERLVRPDIPLLIGGNNRWLLKYAAQKADIIALTGLGATVEGGHRHEARWSEPELGETFALALSGSQRSVKPEIQALVQWTEITTARRSRSGSSSQALRVSRHFSGGSSEATKE